MTRAGARYNYQTCQNKVILKVKVASWRAPMLRKAAAGGGKMLSDPKKCNGCATVFTRHDRTSRRESRVNLVQPSLHVLT